MQAEADDIRIGTASLKLERLDTVPIASLTRESAEQLAVASEVTIKPPG